MLTLGRPMWSYLFNRFGISVTFSLLIDSAEETHLYSHTWLVAGHFLPPAFSSPLSSVNCFILVPLSSFSFCVTSTSASHTRWKQNCVPVVPLIASRPGTGCASWLQRCHFVCPPVAIGLEDNLASWFWSEKLFVHLWQAICFVCSQWCGEWDGSTWPSSTVSPLITSVGCIFTFTHLSGCENQYNALS